MGSVGAPAERGRSPNAAAQTRPRESLDGETIFAVGDEDDEWNEGEPEEEEGGEADKMVKRT